MKKSVSARKKGVTLVEICITIAVFMILMSEALVFSALVRTQLIKNREITKSMREAVMIAELIRDDFYNDDDPALKIKMGADEASEADKEDISKWSVYWLATAGTKYKCVNINNITFEVRKYDADGNITTDGDHNSGDIVICKIKYLLPSQTALGEYKFSLTRHTVYNVTAPSEP